MNKRIVFYYISFALLLTSLLMIIANNVPIFASARWLWSPIFLLFSVLFTPEVFKTKSVVSTLLYGFLYVGIFQYSIWIHSDDWYKRAIFENFYAMIVFVLLFNILIYNKYWRIWGKLAWYSIFFIFITGVMTIIATVINPMVVRASYSGAQFEIENYNFLFRLGFGSYGYITAIVALFPTLIFFIKKRFFTGIKKRILFLSLFFFLIILIRAQIFANILVSAIIIILSLMGSKRAYKSVVYIVIILIIGISIPLKSYGNTFKEIASLFDQNSLMYQKFDDLASFINEPILDENDLNTGAGGRASRYPALFNAFTSSPLLGDASYNSPYYYEMITGAHLYWMSRLALWGILGFIGYLVIIKNVFNPVIKIFDNEFLFYYYMSLLSIILLGLLKNIGGREPFIMLLIIIPGLYISLNPKRQFFL